jgi:hypothetical protein
MLKVIKLIHRMKTNQNLGFLISSSRLWARIGDGPGAKDKTGRSYIYTIKKDV